MTTVGILENHPVIRESISLMLEQEGISTLFQSGEPRPFMSALRARPPDVALVDLRLDGEMGTPEAGIGVIRSIRLTSPEVKIVVLSAVEERALVQICYEAGAVAYLSKQAVGRAQLVSAVEGAARGERWMPGGWADLQDGTLPRLSPDATPLSGLTPRESQVLAYVAGGADNLKISACLNIAERTVKAHITGLYRKLGPENRAQMALLARELGILPPDET